MSKNISTYLKIKQYLHANAIANSYYNICIYPKCDECMHVCVLSFGKCYCIIQMCPNIIP